MQRTDFGAMACSIARTMDIAGEPWTLLVIRNLYVGMSRFTDLQKDLGISKKVLTERLEHLVEHEVVERRPYSERPPRHEYVLTEKGWGLCDVLLAISKWGDRWTAGDAGPPAVFRHHSCGKLTHPIPHCEQCGEELHAKDVTPEAGPGSKVPA